MRKLFLLMLIATFAFINVNAQKTIPSKTLKQVVKLKIPIGETEELKGTRGACVVWHPIQKKYYAAMAGNVDFPFCIFDANGKLLSDSTMKCTQDIRGLWYNTKNKQIEGNSYNDEGWFILEINKNGKGFIPIQSHTGMYQPEKQSVGAYYNKKNTVYFINEDMISGYIADSKLKEIKPFSLSLGWEVKPKDETDYDVFEEIDKYNKGSLVCTNLPKMEIGLLNVDEKRIELYNIATGLVTSKLNFPENAVLPPLFGLAYTNGIYWVFNQDERTWVGYK